MKRLCTFALAALVLSTGGLTLSTGWESSALAAEKSKSRARKSSGNGKATKRPRPSPRTTEPAAEAADSDDAGTAAAPATPPSTSASSSENASGAAPRGKTRVYTFGGLDLEGKLKTPQLLYFRGRMRQELDASSLQRRSFLKELEKTADDQGL